MGTTRWVNNLLRRRRLATMWEGYLPRSNQRAAYVLHPRPHNGHRQADGADCLPARHADAARGSAAQYDPAVHRVAASSSPEAQVGAGRDPPETNTPPPCPHSWGSY